MNLRTIAIVTAVLLAVALAGAFVQNRSGRRVEEPARVGKPVLDVQTAQGAAKLRFDSGAEHATLRSTPHAWVVEEARDFPVQPDFLSQFLFKLTEIKVERLVTKDPAVFAELGVQLASENGGKAEKDKTGVEFQILDEQGKSTFHAVFGNRRKGADTAGVTGSGGMYLRDLEENAVYLLSGAPRVIAKANDWIYSVVLQLEAKKDIKAFRVERPGKPELVLTRIGEPPEKVDFETKVDWSLNALPAGRKLSMRAVGEVAKGIGDLFLANVADPNQSAEKLGRTQVGKVTVETFEGIQYTFTVGEKEDKEGLRYMTAEASLAPGFDKPELKKKVEEYNRVFKGRIFAVHEWVGKRIIPDRDALLEEKS